MRKKSTNQISIRQIAEETGVSTATVSRVFNRHPYVSEDIRQKVARAAKKIGYAPTISSTRFRFGILLPLENDYSFHPYFNQILHAISKEIFQSGYSVQIFNRSEFPYILKNTFCGVIVFYKEDAVFFSKTKIPCIIINHLSDVAYSIVTDHKEGLHKATEYLLKLGHRRIAFLHAAFPNWGTSERLQGYREAMAAAGIPPEEHLYGEFNCRTDIPSAIEKVLKKKPTAMIVEGEDNSLLADHTLKKLKIRIPEDLSLITFESNYSALMMPEHTTICQDFNELGRCAAGTLIQTALHPLSRKKIPPLQILRNDLIERASCAPLSRKK